MARPLPLTDAHRNGTNARAGTRPASLGPLHLHNAPLDEGQEMNGRRESTTGEFAELELARAENAQLRALCQELEQALHEAAQQLRPDLDQQVREYEAVSQEKNELIGQLQSQVKVLKAALETADGSSLSTSSGGEQSELPSEAELLALSEQLERERRQLQEDEQALMDQMREMEVSMARERAELARQRNDMQRLLSEVRHELERLERDGGIQSKIDDLRNKLQDVTTRRGAAPQQGTNRSTPIPPPASAARKEGLMGRLFKRGSD